MSNVDDLFRLTPRYELLKTGIWVVFTLSLGRVIEGLGGVSKVILEYSQAYKWTLLLMLLSMATNIALTWLLIPNYGLLGIAIAASVAVNIYTFGRVLLLYWLYDLLPLRWHLIWAFLWGAVVYLGLFWLPLPFSPIPNMLIRGVLVVVFYVPVVLWLRISPDINDFLLHAWLRLPWRRKQ
jgi:O-antigen/teichoic acid export membrane protein